MSFFLVDFDSTFGSFSVRLTESLLCLTYPPILSSNPPITVSSNKLGNYQGQGKKRIGNLSQYLQRFSDAVSYEKFVSLGFPIGSGEVESAHRYIPQKRLKIPGATWHPDTINPMLALRIIRANDWWQDFWTQQAATRALVA